MAANFESKKILYAASTESHLKNFHMPYIAELRKKNRVFTMATGNAVDFSIAFHKSFFSFGNLKSILRIRSILKRERFDAVILHTTLAAFLIRAAMIGLRRRPFVLNVVHGYLFPSKPKRLSDRILLLCESLLRGKTDEIAVMNAEDLLIATEHKLCCGRVFSIRGMGITLSDVVPDKDLTLRASLVGHGPAFVCGFVGELSRRKNQMFLIHAVSKLRERGIPIQLLLIGEGGLRETLEKEIATLGLKDVIYLCGARSPILPYLSVIDLYLSASISEGLPFNVMEAMSCGLPIVASNTKGQVDLLGGTDAVLYPASDMDAFCDAVQQVYQSKRYGVGSVIYPEISNYRLDAVFEENIQQFTVGMELL